MLHIKIVRPDEAYFNLRFKVLREPLGMEQGSELDPSDAESLHLAAYFDQEIVGILRINEEELGVVRLRYMAVAEAHQGKQVGQKLVEKAIAVAQKVFRADRLVLDAREGAVGFYEKQGFVIEQGPYEKIGIPHYYMSLDVLNPPSPPFCD